MHRRQKSKVRKCRKDDYKTRTPAFLPKVSTVSFLESGRGSNSRLASWSPWKGADIFNEIHIIHQLPDHKSKAANSL